ncbi:hypothetical protein TNCV_5047761 [Trichonephila clavipes]|nr:hypothetical protein TNCV_5047761 [Trichonephila clavipes]
MTDETVEYSTATLVDSKHIISSMVIGTHFEAKALIAGKNSTQVRDIPGRVNLILLKCAWQCAKVRSTRHNDPCDLNPVHLVADTGILITRLIVDKNTLGAVRVDRVITGLVRQLLFKYSVSSQFHFLI